MKNSNAVFVVANAQTGELITPSTKRNGWGSISVASKAVSIVGGILQAQKRNALIQGEIELLEAMGYFIGQQLTGKIVRCDSFDPFWANQSPRINPTTKEVVLTNGRESYISLEYTENTDARDMNLLHVASVAVPTVSADQAF